MDGPRILDEETAEVASRLLQLAYDVPMRNPDDCAGTCTRCGHIGWVWFRGDAVLCMDHEAAARRLVLEAGCGGY